MGSTHTDGEKLAIDRLSSRNQETEIYLNSLRAMYDKSFAANAFIYDIASELTEHFANITADAILRDSRIIKILRYSIAPSISQMKFGQFVGLNSVDKFEERQITSGVKFESLKSVADKMALFVRGNLDKDRFTWIEPLVSPTEEAKRSARNWTCSMAADQNAETMYRNWRKEKQENGAKEAIENLGYLEAETSGTINNLNDLEPGTYITERRVQGRTIQKADLVCRSKKNQKLVLIEAKAVGVELDATKRIKECCDKANDWRSNDNLSAPIVVALIAGFFTEKNIENLEASNVTIVWEHDMAKFSKVL